MLAFIGSAALKYHVSDFRKPLDYDYVGDYDELVGYLKRRDSRFIVPIDNGKKLLGKVLTVWGYYNMVECEITWPDSTAEELYNLILKDEKSLRIGTTCIVASLDILYLLKMTHRFKKNSPHFMKTMNDIHFLRSKGAVIRDEHRAFYKRRLKETLDYKHPKLNQSKKDFFTDDVPYIYDHDSIHEAIKLYRKPAYNFFKPDEKEVFTSKKMFLNLPREIQLAAVYEESCVLALERSQIPYPEMDKRKSFEMALQKVCTSITSGWFREFAWENYHSVLEIYDEAWRENYGYTDCLKHGLEAGIIKPHRKD